MENNPEISLEEIDENQLTSRCSAKSLSEIFEDDTSYSSIKINLMKSNPKNSNLLEFSSKNLYKKSDFEFIETIGRGAYAKVVKAKLIRENKNYAIKIFNKSFVVTENKLFQVYIENEILTNLDHPNIIKIYGIFEENEKIYLVLEYCAFGDFQDFIKDNLPLSFEIAQYYTAQIISALEYLHNNLVIHRDLKPENLMLDKKMQIKLIDFGTAKIIGKEFNKNSMKFENPDVNPENYKSFFLIRKNTIDGTSEYLSPEVLNACEVGPGTDLWALGCIIYQMFTEISPFKEKTEFLVFRKIMNRKIDYPSTIPQKAISIIQRLLHDEPSKRLGAGPMGSENDYSVLRNHEFFQGFLKEDNNSIDTPLKIFPRSLNKLKQNIRDGLKVQKENTDAEKKIIKEGYVERITPWSHFNTRRLILYDSKKLELIDPQYQSQKGVILLSFDSKSILKDKDRFDLLTNKFTFEFLTQNNEAVEWNKAINDIISS